MLAAAPLAIETWEATTRLEPVIWVLQFFHGHYLAIS